MAGRLITLETGLLCNNRCAFCPQPPLRASGRGFTDPDAAEMRRRIDRARDEGHDQIAFSGGEPTLRKDLPDLVAHARAAGFQRVSVTTNGRMLAYPAYGRRLLDAGLTGVSVSLHGPRDDVHDALTGVPGSFRQAVEGLRGMAGLAAGRPGRFDLNTITVLVPGNVDLLRPTLELAGSLGATLHVVQPFILSRETAAVGPAFLLDRDRIVEALRRALATPLPHGGRVKPYNLAPCLLEGLPGVDAQDYGLKTFRMHRPDPGPGGGFRVAGQFWRDDRCEGCPAACPGHRLEHLPQREAAGWILQDLAASLPPVAGRDVSLDGLDLLDAGGLEAVLGGLRGLGPARVRLLWGGLGRAPAGEVLAACARHGVDEACLVVQPPRLRLPDRGAWLPGNLQAVAEALSRFRPGEGPRPSLFLVPAMCLDPDWDLPPEGLAALAGMLAAAGGDRAFLAAPEGLDPEAPLHDPAFRDRLAGAIPGILETLAGAGIRAFLVPVAGVPPVAGGPRLQDRLARLVPVQDWGPTLLDHRLSGPRLGWVSWSRPSWIREDLAGLPGASSL